jgi:hydrogenase expression/formation protein HypC
MCLAVPGRILNITDSNGVRYGRVNFGGVVREVCLAFVPEASIDDYVIVHVGFAISRVHEEEARRTFELLQKMGVLEAEFKSDGQESVTRSDKTELPKVELR